jgi:hypothetical protein
MMTPHLRGQDKHKQVYYLDNPRPGLHKACMHIAAPLMQLSRLIACHG